MNPSVPTIIHVDMDAFYAAIEQRDNPALRGRPVVVGAPPDRRGVVATASYEARQFGIRSAMPSRTAGKLCPQAVFLPPRMKHYEQVSDQLMTILRQFTPLVEPVSLDEAFLDVRGVLHFWPGPAELAYNLKNRIRADLALTASVGIAANKFLAKIASDLKKPDGLSVVPTDPEAIRAFLAPLPVGRLWGVGKVTERHLHAAGIRTIGQIQTMSDGTLRSLLGVAAAEHIGRLALGIDDRPVTMDEVEKSISNETTFDKDCVDPEVWRQTLIELAENVGRRLRRAGKTARTGTIKVRFEDFTTVTRQQGFVRPVDTDRAIVSCALELFRKLAVRRPVRLLGVGVSNLSANAAAPTPQALLFPEADTSPQQRRDRSLDKAVDAVRRHFGRGALKRGDWQAGAEEE